MEVDGDCEAGDGRNRRACGGTRMRAVRPPSQEGSMTNEDERYRVLSPSTALYVLQEGR